MPVHRLALLLPLILLFGCSGDDDPVAVVPSGPTPEPVTDLIAVAGAAGSLTLAWSSPQLPGDLTGTISYEMRHCAPGNEDGPFEAWTGVAAPTGDTESGVSRQHQINGLTAGATYLLRLRSRVGTGAWSPVSNTVVATAATQHDRTRPAPVTEFRQWAGTAQSVTVAFAAAGDDSIYGAASAHEVRWHETATDWESMTPATGPVTPTTKTNWLRTTIEGFTADSEITVRVRAVDEEDNVSAISDLFHLTADTMRVWYVNVDGTGDTATLQEAAQLAGPGDLVLVGPGRYTWTEQGTGHPLYGMIWIPLNHYGFTIRGEEGPENTILDGERMGPIMVVTGVILGPGEDVPLWPGITVEGLTMTRGLADGEPASGVAYTGGAITLHVSNAVIRNCILTRNEATEGGAIWCGGQGQPIIENCRITSNVARDFGGGVRIINSEFPVRVRNTTISGNKADRGGGIAIYNALVDFDYLMITGNEARVQGGGLMYEYVHENNAMTNCTVAGNEGGLGTAIRIGTRSVVVLEKCILFGNSGGPAFSIRSDSDVQASCTVVNGHEVSDWPNDFMDEGGNFNLDPMFCDFNSYTLRSGSPCLPGNHPAGSNCGTMGARNQGCSR